MDSLQPSCFSSNSADHGHLSSFGPSGFSAPPHEFQAHLQTGKHHQELGARNPTAHLEHPASIPENPLIYADGGRMLPSFACVRANEIPTHTFMDSGELAGIEWSGKLSYMLPHRSQSSDTLAEHPSALLSASSVRELSPRMGSDDNRGSSSQLMTSLLLGASPPLSEMDRLLSNSWSSFTSSNTPLDPPGMPIQAPHLGDSFSAGALAFPERAEKFSSFINKQCYLELSQTFPVAADEGKVLSRSRSLKSSQEEITKLHSEHHTPSCSAPNSPCISAAQEPVNGLHEQHFLLEQATCHLATENSILSLEKRTLGLESFADINHDLPKKRCTSINESDESMGQEVSSSCERNGGGETSLQRVDESPVKKRRTGPNDRPSKVAGLALSKKVLPQDVETGESKEKGQKSGNAAFEVGSKPKAEPSQSMNSDDSTPKSTKETTKPPEAPKPDYIHVRARRGQATDSHSLAERVRREKISERMKFLQDLVPGCSKVTGKAVMLDEIINYVQSLQRQVEFLSMKLAAVNPRLDLSIESLFAREMVQQRVPSQKLIFVPEKANSYATSHEKQPLQSALRSVGSWPPMDVQTVARDPNVRTMNNPVGAMDAYGDQVSQGWDNELHSFVQMGFSQGRQTPLSSPNLQGQLLTGKMKVEL